MNRIVLNEEKLNEIYKVLAHRRGLRIQKLRCHKQARLAHLKKKLLGTSKVLQINSDDAANFLTCYGEDLIKKIHQLSKSFIPRDALFILARLPWAPSGSRSGVTNARRLARTILINLENPNINRKFKEPKVTENLVNRVILFDDLCADLHQTQSVYRVLEKAAFFGVRRALEFHQRSFSVVMSNNDMEAINSYNARARRGGISFWNELTRPVNNAPSLGLYVHPIHKNIPQLQICPEERNAQVVDLNFPEGWPFFCLDGDPVSSLQSMKSSFDINRLNQSQKNALSEMIYIAGIRQLLYDIRCAHISKVNYRYDIERKGYIKLEWSTCQKGIRTRTELIARSILPEELVDPMLDQLDMWLQSHTSYYHKYPDTISKNWQHPLFAKADKGYVLHFPDILEFIEHEVHERLNKGGVIGTEFYGVKFEKYLRNHMRQSGVGQYGWNEWNIDQPFVHPDTREHIAQIDYACYRDTILFVVDAKSYRGKMAIEKNDANKDWKKIKRKLSEVINTSEKLVSNWQLLNPPPPPGIRHVIPIACTPLPVFSKVCSPYFLYSVRLENQLEQEQELVTIPTICTVEEFAEVLKVFDFDEYLRAGGMSIDIQ